MRILAALAIAAALAIGLFNTHALLELERALRSTEGQCQARNIVADDAKFQAQLAERAAKEAVAELKAVHRRLAEVNSFAGGVLDNVEAIEKTVEELKSPTEPPLSEERVRALLNLGFEEKEDAWKVGVMREVDSKVSKAVLTLSKLIVPPPGREAKLVGGRKPLPLPDDEITEPAGELEDY